MPRAGFDAKMSDAIVCRGSHVCALKEEYDHMWLRKNCEIGEA